MAGRFGPTQHFEGGQFGNAVLTGLPILNVEIHPLPYSEATPALQTCGRQTAGKPRSGERSYGSQREPRR